MDLEIIILSEVSQTDKDKYITYMWNIKIIQMNLFIRQKQTYRSQNLTYGHQRGTLGKVIYWD